MKNEFSCFESPLESPDEESIGFTEGFYSYFFKSPLDSGWEFLPTVDDIANKVAIESETNPWCGVSLKKFTEDLRMVKKVLKKNNFRPDYGIHLLWFPVDEHLEYAFLTKTSDNGTTAIISRIDLGKWPQKWFERSYKL